MKLTNLIIIDASGSMDDKIDEVKGGLKQLFSQIKTDAQKDKKKVKTTTIVLDFSGHGDSNVIVHSTDSSLLTEDVADRYKTRGMTALLDAIGKGFSLVPSKQLSVFVSIITDGLENDSKEFTKDQIKDLIQSKRKENWVITFMGTTEEAIQEARSIGISAGNTMSFTNSGDGMKTAGSTITSARAMFYSSNTAEAGSLTKEIDMDNLLNEASKNNQQKPTETKIKNDPSNTVRTK